MRNIFIDTNIFLDYFLSREPLFTPAKNLLEHCINFQAKGHTSVKSILDIHYFLNRGIEKQKAKQAINFLLDFIEVQSIDVTALHFAISSPFTDFEDAVQYYTAIQYNDIDCIITNNKKDFKHSALPVYTAEEFLNLVN